MNLLKADRKQKLASISAASMANRDTPLIRNAWYVAARSDEISRTLFSRQYLGINTVLFRREDGTPVALQNRCCHRSFPLSEGKLHGDILECGYHGFRYNSAGRLCSGPVPGPAPAKYRRAGVSGY